MKTFWQKQIIQFIPIVFFTVHLLKVSNGETETELFWGSWWDQPVSNHYRLERELELGLHQL